MLAFVGPVPLALPFIAMEVIEVRIYPELAVMVNCQ
jgi:hypothetical protein